ncbi:hypothetical protein DL96DRAFT_541558 [Flagelloscypha sp. PMI_526]|nr:hypothetical protein DL96DRAFT_541558 [Flagelloscypha sp. PMI_526]
MSTIDLVSLGDPILPQELIFMILDLALHSNPPQSWPDVLTLSKAIHSWWGSCQHGFLGSGVLLIFTHQRASRELYHTIDFSETSRSVPSHLIDRKLLVQLAPVASLSSVKRIRARTFSHEFTFSLFSNLTHLILWGSNYLDSWPSCAKSIMMLPLEELFIWEHLDDLALLKHLSPEVTVYHTLRGLGGYSDYCNSPHKGWSQCRNLVHLLVLGREYTEISQCIVSDIRPLENLKTCMIGPAFSTLTKEGQEEIISDVVGDKRIVLLSDRPAYLFPSTNSFWSQQNAARQEAESHVLRNPHRTGVVVLSSVDE